jgi:hypothetical protein
MFGAFIGTVAAFEVNRWFWWLGLLAGGLTGYLSFEWRTIVRAVPVAWRAATKLRMPKRENPVVLLNMLLTSAVTMSWVACSYAGIRLSSWVMSTYGDFAGFWLCINVGSKIAFGLALVVSLCIVTGTLATTFDWLEGKQSLYYELKGAEDELKWNWRISAPIVVGWYLPLGIVMLVRRTPAAGRFILIRLARIPGLLSRVARFVGRFFRNLFLLIHSDERLICGVDALLGTAFGYFAHSVIIGMLAGGVLGIVNYELVTKRWLMPRGYVTRKARQP